MANLFDSSNYPETEPANIIAGDRAAWKRTDLGIDYAPASYSLKYSARLENIQPGLRAAVQPQLILLLLNRVTITLLKLVNQ